jgi:hypothetical protein
MQSLRCAEAAGDVHTGVSGLQRYVTTALACIKDPHVDHYTDANENSEAQVAGLVKEFTTFHACLIELGELMKQYGQPMPFPCKDFEETLKRCDKTLNPYADHLVDKKMTVKKFIFTIRYIGMEKEIDGLRKQITGHYQALHMCISFLQL